MTKILPAPASFEIWSGVNNLLQAYADGMDRADIAAILTNFAPDAHWDYAPGTSLRGHAALAQFFKTALGVYAHTHHQVGPPKVWIDADGGTIHSIAYLTAQHIRKDGSRFTGFGRYVNDFVITKTGLLISRMGVVSHFSEGAARAYNVLERMDPAALLLSAK